MLNVTYKLIGLTKNNASGIIYLDLKNEPEGWVVVDKPLGIEKKENETVIVFSGTSSYRTVDTDKLNELLK